MKIGACIIEMRLPSARSLKQKRGQLKSLLARLQREFNLAVSESGHNNLWQSAQIAMVAVSNEQAVAEQVLRRAVLWIERNRPDLEVVAAEIEWR